MFSERLHTYSSIWRIFYVRDILLHYYTPLVLCRMGNSYVSCSEARIVRQLLNTNGWNTYGIIMVYFTKNLRAKFLYIMYFTLSATKNDKYIVTHHLANKYKNVNCKIFVSTTEMRNIFHMHAHICRCYL